MKEPRVENGIVVGTGSDKFQQRNPIVRWALKGFDQALLDLVAELDVDEILEVGCGEGHVTQLLLDATRARIRAFDISASVLEEARQAVSSERVSFGLLNVSDLEPATHAAPLVVCCEVLEHLEDPVAGLRRLAEAAQPYAILSVPREPIFRTLNFLRGAHLATLGNSPGHLQHWSRRSFLRFVQSEFDIVRVRSPLPWTAVLARSRRMAPG